MQTLRLLCPSTASRAASRAGPEPSVPAPSAVCQNLYPEEPLESQRARHLSQQDLVSVSGSFLCLLVMTSLLWKAVGVSRKQLLAGGEGSLPCVFSPLVLGQPDNSSLYVLIRTGIHSALGMGCSNLNVMDYLERGSSTFSLEGRSTTFILGEQYHLQPVGGQYHLQPEGTQYHHQP